MIRCSGQRLFSFLEGPFKKDGPQQGRRPQGCRECGCVPIGLWKIRVRQNGVRRCWVRPLSRGGRDLQPPGGTNSTVMDHVAEKTNIRDGLELPLCKETSLLPPPWSTREISRRKGEGRRAPGAGGCGPASSWRLGCWRMSRRLGLESNDQASFSELEWDHFNNWKWMKIKQSDQSCVEMEPTCSESPD